MVDTGWNYCYKIFQDKANTTNALYTPTVNSHGNILCMHWDPYSTYQLNKKLNSQLIDFFFRREVKYLTAFQGKYYAPKILDIDYKNKKIFTTWNKNTVNDILFVQKKNLNTVCPDWKQQIFLILQNIQQFGFIKTALYPHCFYLDDGMLKTFDFYGCVEISNPYVKITDIAGMIGSDSVERFSNATDGEYLNVETFFKNTLLNHMHITWPDNPFPEYYWRLYEKL